MARPWEGTAFENNEQGKKDMWGPDKISFPIPSLNLLIRDNDIEIPEDVNFDELSEEQIYDVMAPKLKEKGVEAPPKYPDLTREEFYDAMVAQGWNKEGDDKTIAAMYWLGNHNLVCNNPDTGFLHRMMTSPAATDEQRSELLKLASDLEYNQLRVNSHDRDILSAKRYRINDERKRTDFRSKLKANGGDMAVDERVLDVLYDCYELQGDDTGVSRINFNEKMNGERSAFSNFLASCIRRAERDGWFADEGEKHKLDILKEEYKKQNDMVIEAAKRKEKADYQYKMAPIRQYIEYAVKNGLDEMQDGDAQLEVDWIQDEDPLRTQRKQNLLSARNHLLRPLLSIINDPHNAEYVEKIKAGEDTSEMSIYCTDAQYNAIIPNRKQHDEVKVEQNMNILVRVNSMSLDNTKDLFTDYEVENSFWNTYSRTLTEKEIRDMQDKFISLAEAGLNWDEYADTSAYDKLMRSHGFKTSEYNASPYYLAKRSIEGKAGAQELKDTLSVAGYEKTMAALDVIEEAFNKNKENFMDMDVLELSGWFNHSGYDMIQNTVLMTNGFEEKIVDGKSVKFIDLSNSIDDSRLDRDLLDMDSYKKLVESAKEAQKIYNDNKDTFRKMFDTMDAVHHSNLGGEILGDMVQEVSMNKETLKEMNRFRHLLYNMRVADADVCKLVDLKDNKKAVLVQPLDEKTEFNKNMVDQEKDYLDTCIEMLREPTTRVNRSSKEYWNIIDSINDMKKNKSKDFESNDAAKQAYIKSVNKILNDINIYREHKAKDGVKNDATHDKLIALERVDKLLRTRYKSIEQREYEDNISGISELFKVEVEENKMGDEYLLDKALQKINNMNKSLADLKAEFEIIDKEDAEKIMRTNTIGAAASEEKILSSIMDGFDEKKKNEMLKVTEKLDDNAHLKSVESKEEAFRKKLDPKDDYGKEKLIASAEKELYMASVKAQANIKAVTEGPEAGEKIMNSRLGELDKGNNLRYRAFKFENLTDKDFNKEFQKKVLESAENGKTTSKDILKCADDALTSCYEKYRGKDTKNLDKLSATLGSKVNAQSVKNKVNIGKLKKEEEAAAPKKAKKEEAPIKRSRSLDDVSVHDKKEQGPKKK